MNQELLQAIKRRKQKLGVDDPEPEKPQQAAKPKAEGHGENFNQNKKMLEELFGGKKNQVVVEVKKEEIKGDQQGFKNARAKLEQQFGKGPNTNAMNINSGGSPGGLPPPPPPMPSMPGTFNIPLPPPPPPMPSFDSLPPLPPLTLPPPPPPPPMNLPPPPSFNAINLPPPPPFNPPPAINLPTPPAQPKYVPPPQPPTISLPPPPPPINLPPPPAPPPTILPPPPAPINLPPPPQKQVILPPPPPSPQFNSGNSQKQPVPVFNPQKTQPTVLPPPPPPPQPQEQQACFILSGGSTKPSVPVVTAWDKDDLEKSKKKRIFDKKSEKKYPITQELFGKNLGAFVKQEFLRTVNILGVIDKQVKKEVYEFHFPTIENKIRNIEPIETLYADTDTLDLVSCYMTKNLNAARLHNEQRDQFVSQLHNYNWQADQLKLKQIRESAAPFPPCVYVEPNFVQIKNSFKRIDNLINNLAQQQDFNKCNQLKGLKVETEKMLNAYLAHPTSNASLIERIDANVNLIKNLQV